MIDLTRNISSLNKSTDNIRKATNTAQREAARGFLHKRATELHEQLKALESWLQEADTYINRHEPGINADPDAEYNQQWITQLRQYEQAQAALDSAWSAYMETLEAA